MVDADLYAPEKSDYTGDSRFFLINQIDHLGRASRGAPRVARLVQMPRLQARLTKAFFARQHEINKNKGDEIIISVITWPAGFYIWGKRLEIRTIRTMCQRREIYLLLKEAGENVSRRCDKVIRPVQRAR